MKNTSNKLIVLIIMIFSHQSLAASFTNFEKYLKNNIRTEGPGIAYIVTKQGKTIYSGAYGMANIELSTPMSTNSVFKLASITKQFTSAAILILQEQGKMSIKDNIHKYIPNYPTEGHEITIENLMSHTSGIARNFPDRRKLNKLRKSSTTVDEMLTLFAKEPMQFSPGEKMRYSNIGYVLLGKIIEVVSGQSYAEFIEINIFKKLGMNDSQYDGLQIVPNRATGYHRTRYGYENADWVDSSWRYAAGGLVSTVNDLALWYHSLASGKLISLNSYRQMIEPFKLNDGRQSHYALGLNNFEIHKNKVIAHNGGTSGFSTSAVYFPEQDSYIAVLSNERPSDPQKLLLLLSAEMLGISYPEFKSTKVENSQLKKMMGKYQIGQDSVRRLFEEEGLVYSQRDNGLPYEVIPMSDNSFYFKGSLSYFVIEKDDNDNQVMLYYSSLSEIPERAVKLWLLESWKGMNMVAIEQEEETLVMVRASLKNNF